MQADAVAERLSGVRHDIDALGRGDVRIVAVTKALPVETLAVAHEVGLRDIGENYAQELVSKFELIDPDTRIHFIGRIQRNKVKKIVDRVDQWHSVARPEILHEIGKRKADASVLLQINPTNDPSKDGVGAQDIESMLETAEAAGVTVDGLMTIGVHGDAEATRAAFSEVDTLCQQWGLHDRSMGMSGDYRDALEAGATILRLGSVLFGPRPQR
jgi:pyridoxal phosphate enzyme (YggS family)